jgi:CRISPR-associated protein Csd2
MTNTIQNRYDFVLLFDVQDGNPNGDPDAGNMPRVDAQTGKGLVTDVCLKRKIRNYVGLKHGEQPPYEIYVKEKTVLNSQHARGYIAVGAEDELETNNKGHVKSKGKSDNKDARQWMCKNFYDVRTFGAVMSTGVNCGQVRGPIQLTFARSVGPIVTLEHALTVCAARKDDKPVEEQIGIQGRKFTVPYGLYCAHGFVSAPLAAQTGFSEDDLTLLWESLNNMFEHDRSAARGLMSTRKLVVFKHESNMGNAPAHALFERVQATLKGGVTAPRSFSDYDVNVDVDNLPNGVSILDV